MGFYLRKSLTLGPLRFNLSKSGIGVSAGIKGLRMGTGPRGNYIHAGRGGLYYRASLPTALRSGTTPVEQTLRDKFENNNAESLAEIDSSDVLAMKDSSSEELLEELNVKCKKKALWPLSQA